MGIRPLLGTLFRRLDNISDHEYTIRHNSMTEHDKNSRTGTGLGISMASRGKQWRKEDRLEGPLITQQRYSTTALSLPVTSMI